MKMDRVELQTVFDLIAFSPAQRQAVEAVFHKVQGSATLAAKAGRDCDSLADPQGPDWLHLNANELCQTLGESAGMYPVLILISRVGWLREQYERLGIDMQILRDTLSDIPLWINNCQAHTGRMGLQEYTWLTNHLRMRLFRLGRLEYIYTQSRVPAWFYRHRSDGKVMALAQDGIRFDASGELTESSQAFRAILACDSHQVTGHPVDSLGLIQAQSVVLDLAKWDLALAPGDPVLDVHIPEGPPMLPNNITASLAYAPVFYQEKLGIADARAFTCGSWLMAPALGQIAPESNLAAFQALFRVVPYTVRDNQVFERVYGRALNRWEDMPMKTRLQRGIRDWYLAGRKCRQMQGVILLDKSMKEAMK